MEPRGRFIYKRPPGIHSLSRINPISRTDTDFLILSSHQLLDLPRDLFSVGPLSTFWKQSYLLPFCLCPAHLNFLGLISLNILNDRYKLRSTSLWNLLQSWSLLGANIRLRISNTLCLLSTLEIRDHVSQLPMYSTTGNIIVLYIFDNTCKAIIITGVLRI